MRPVISILDTMELAYIDRLSRDILENVGFVCEDEEAVAIFTDNGAKLDRHIGTLRIPGGMVDRVKETFSPMVFLHGRGERAPLEVGGDNVYFGTTGFATNYLDEKSGEYRASLYDDLVRMIRLCDVLDPPDYILASIGPTDVDSRSVDLYEFKAALLHSTKHIQTEATNRENARKIIQMAEIVNEERVDFREKPFFSFLVTLSSPLHHRTDSMQLIIEAASQGIPLFIESGPMAGATSPVTLAQTVAMANAELLSGIILAKLVNPDTPVIYASWARVINMKNGNVSVGSPEFGMLRIATSQMGKYYGLPVGGGGNLTDSLSVDAQLGVEQCSTSLLPALAGTNMIQGMGLLAGMNAASPEALAVASETASYVKWVCRGIKTDESPANFELISNIGPGGDFLKSDHTFKNFKKELWARSIFDCSAVRKGGKRHLEKNVLENAKLLMGKRMEGYRPPSLPQNAEGLLEKVICS